MPTCLIGLGSNLGDRAANLRTALRFLSEHAAITSVESSSFHATSPIGGPSGQHAFLNAAACIETTLKPHALFSLLQQIETDRGRERGARWAARVIDLDLLLYEHEVIDTPALQVPHPRMAFRRFVLAPAVEVAAEMVHPTIGWTVQQLLDHLNTAIDYVAITGMIGTGKTTLAREIAASIDIAWIRDVAVESSLQTYLTGQQNEALKTELQLAESRSQVLRQLKPDTGPAVSDFWFNQSVAFARTWLSGDSLRQFEHNWIRLQHGRPVPKLLVLLDTGSEMRASELTTDQVENFCASLQQAIAQHHKGPVLRVCEWEMAVVEITAAIQAMQ